LLTDRLIDAAADDDGEEDAGPLTNGQPAFCTIHNK